MPELIKPYPDGSILSREIIELIPYQTSLDGDESSIDAKLSGLQPDEQGYNGNPIHLPYKQPIALEVSDTFTPDSYFTLFSVNLDRLSGDGTVIPRQAYNCFTITLRHWFRAPSAIQTSLKQVITRVTYVMYNSDNDNAKYEISSFVELNFDIEDTNNDTAMAPLQIPTFIQTPSNSGIMDVLVRYPEYPQGGTSATLALHGYISYNSMF